MSVLGCPAASMERISGGSRSNPMRYLDTRRTLIWDRRTTPRARIGNCSSNPKIHVPILRRSLAVCRRDSSFARKISMSRKNSRDSGKVQSPRLFFCGYAHALRCHQDMQSLKIESQTHQAPFAGNFLQAAQRKLAESENFFDDANHGFHSAFS